MTESFCHRRWQTLTNDLILGSFATGYILEDIYPPWQMHQRSGKP